MSGRAGHRPRSRGDFERVYRGAYPRVYRTLAAILSSPTDAAECTQDAFIRAFQAWEGWRQETPPELLIHRIAVDRAASYRRRARLRTVGALFRRIGGSAGSADSPDLATQRSVVSALRTMHPKLAASIVLCYYHGYSNREIATVLGVSERTVVNRLREASERLRAAFEVPPSSELTPTLPIGGLQQYAED
jgi:RNA polymerase sigma-70 factor, ECF subfamily